MLLYILVCTTIRFSVFFKVEFYRKLVVVLLLNKIVVCREKKIIIRWWAWMISSQWLVKLSFTSTVYNNHFERMKSVKNEILVRLSKYSQYYSERGGLTFYVKKVDMVHMKRKQQTKTCQTTFYMLVYLITHLNIIIIIKWSLQKHGSWKRFILFILQKHAKVSSNDLQERLPSLKMKVFVFSLGLVYRENFCYLTPQT